MAAKTGPLRQKRYRQRLEGQGLRYIALWCPADWVETIRSVTAGLAEREIKRRLDQEAGGCIEGGGSPPMRAEPANVGQETDQETRGSNVVQLGVRLAAGSIPALRQHCPTPLAGLTDRQALALALDSLTDDEAALVSMFTACLVTSR